MEIPQEYLAIKVSFNLKSNTTHYSISHKREGQYIPIQNSIKFVFYFRRYGNKSINNYLAHSLFIRALDKGLVWTQTDNPRRIEASEFKWNAFLCSTYQSLERLPPLGELKEQYSSFEMKDVDIKNLFLKDGTIMDQYFIAIDVTRKPKLIAAFLEHIDQKCFVSVVENEDKDLELFNTTETFLFMLV